MPFEQLKAEQRAAETAAETAERTTTARLTEMRALYETNLTELRERLAAAEHPAERPTRGRSSTPTKDATQP